MVALLQWPDVKLPSCLAAGFQITGEVPEASIFRPCAPKQAGKAVELQAGDELRGMAAKEFVDGLEGHVQIGPQTDTIYKITQDEVDEGLAEPLVPRHSMDERFGVGGWRPLPRHVIWQSEKWRPIDDGKKAGTNAHTKMAESVVCIPPEFLVLTTKALKECFERVAGAQPEWAAGVRFGTEDWWKGFRQIGPTAEDRGMAVIAVVNPTTRQWEYSALRGLPFGLGSAVNQFNRLPSLITAMARRLLYIMVGHYVDDNAMVELELLGTNAQEAFGQMTEELVGVMLSKAKRQWMTTMAAFLGHIHDLSRIRTDHAICYGPKPSMRANMESLIVEALQEGRLTAGTAAKMRGIGTWLDTGLAGRCCRGAMTALTARQYWEHGEGMTQNLEECLRYLLAAVRLAPDRAVWLDARRKRPVVVYTDASDEKGVAKIGGIAFRDGWTPQA
jgi:hypothetical protein